MDWDPEIAAQLDGLDGEVIENPPEEDEDYDDFDNIVAMANEGASDEEAEMDEFDRWRLILTYLLLTRERM